MITYQQWLSVLNLVEFALIPLQHQNPPTPPPPTGGQTTGIRLGWTQLSTECLSYCLGQIPGLFSSDACLWCITWCVRLTNWHLQRVSGYLDEITSSKIANGEQSPPSMTNACHSTNTFSSVSSWKFSHK